MGTGKPSKFDNFRLHFIQVDKAEARIKEARSQVKELRDLARNRFKTAV